jgi:endonuclease/exonuclease/phosphatase family metal-dependent hydrolase
LILNWRETFDSDRSNSEVNLGSGFSLVMLGPWMLLQMLLLGSHGFIGEVANISPSLSFTVVILGYAAALIGAYVGFKSPHGLPPLLALLFSGVLGITNYFAVGSGPYYIPVLLFSQGYLGFGLALVGVANSKGARIGLARTTVISGLGMILLLILLFGFYMAQDIALPFQRSLFPAVAGFLVGLAILQATIHVRSHAATATRYPDALIAALALLVVPLGHWVLADQPPMLKAASGEDVRVMTYNIHSGINPYGQPDLEAIARVIEASGADIIGLQEVSRMRLQDASMDMPYWLAKRLGMAYIFRGTEEPIWGNAILSRYPIIEWGWADLPRAGKLIGRGYLWSRIDTGGPEPILVIATHLHHLEPDSQARQQQVPELVQFGAGQSHVIVLGDMNAEPGSAEMNMFSEAGLIDAWALAGQGSGYTFSSLDPEKRIDWLWFSDDLIPREIEVIQTHASDHLPVDALFTFK